jgi:hypothetical protein
MSWTLLQEKAKNFAHSQALATLVLQLAESLGSIACWMSPIRQTVSGELPSRQRLDLLAVRGQTDKMMSVGEFIGKLPSPLLWLGRHPSPSQPPARFG